MAPGSHGARPDAPPARGVLRSLPEGELEHRRVLLAEDLRPFVAHLWRMRWRCVEPRSVETLPHPSVHLVVELPARRGEVVGVHTGRFVRQLVGEGSVVGIKFRPATFRPFLGASVATLTDRSVPLDVALGPPALALVEHVASADDLDVVALAVEAFLRSMHPTLDDEQVALRDVVEATAVDRSIVRVDDVASRLGLDVRTTQRRFRRDVGVSPKWVIARHRLHEAAERLRGPSPPPIGRLAAELGYADQSHFVRDFKAVIGCAPRPFARGS